MGIDVDRVILLVFLIGPALGGMAGLMVGLYYGANQLYNGMGLWSESLYGCNSRGDRQHSWARWLVGCCWV